MNHVTGRRVSRHALAGALCALAVAFTPVSQARIVKLDIQATESPTSNTTRALGLALPGLS